MVNGERKKGNSCFRGPLSSQENDREMKGKTEDLSDVTCKRQRCADLQRKQMNTGGSQNEPTRKSMRNKAIEQCTFSPQQLQENVGILSK